MNDVARIMAGDRGVKINPSLQRQQKESYDKVHDSDVFMIDNLTTRVTVYI